MPIQDFQMATNYTYIRNLKWLPNIHAQQDCLSKGQCSLLEVFYKKDLLEAATGGVL